MRRTAVAFALLLSGCGSDEALDKAPGPRPATVMTFNVMCSICGSSDFDPWEKRLAYFGDIFERYDPDLVGIQELTPIGDEVAQVQAELSGHSAVYFAPEDALPYPDATIFYRTSRYELLDSGEYWLSPTPDVANSTGFSPPQLARLVVWAHFEDKAGGRDLYFATTHFDNNSPSQEKSAPLVKQRTLDWQAQYPAIVVGDFNSKPSSTAFQILTSDSDGFAFVDSQSLAEEWSAVSNQDPTPSYDLTDRIDHIFLAGQDVSWTVKEWHPDLSVYGDKNRYPSDHFPIAATLDFH
ncbi:MAG: endonuclease/exonuclease/phosphatase family protein [Myxococcales bacterium]|nr:endonuclease/exonuclease/phosphatase family protein [Myxococcales bacterium]MCB9579731.1 endonuclease/exonuclease/phosphatase family protein [Polyangiaceae bacterium]